MSEGVSVKELVDRLYAATQRMGRKNTHRALMLHAMSAIMQMSKRIDAQEEREAEARERDRPLVQLVQ